MSLPRRFRKVVEFIFLAACLTAPAAVSAAPLNKEPPKTELVLREGSRLEVTSPKGNIAIVAGKGFARQYQWDGCALDANMSARTYRWFGSLGIYDPAGRFGQSDFLKHPSCKGVSRTIVEEGQIHFSNVESAEEWIRHRPTKSSTTLWTNDGLVISWISSPYQSRGVAIGGFSGELMLVCINGRRPTRLAGASDDAFRLVHANGSDHAVHECANVGNGVITETQRVLIEDWKKYGGYVERKK